jgi:general secretion pathway protein B
MSFILEAIAKSEQQRQQQQMPDARVLSLPAVHVKRRRRFLPFLVVTALLLNAIVIAMWMQSERTMPDQAAPVKPENMEPAIEQAAVPGIAKPANPTTPDEVTTDEATTDAGIPAESPQTEKPATVNKSLSGQQITAPRNTGETVTGVVGEPESVQPETAAMEIDGVTDAWTRSDPETLSNATQAVTKVEPEGMQIPAEKARRVFSLGELPSDVRKDLPTVTFSGHLYSQKPGVGVVFVDGGRPVKEGRQIVDDLVLQKITPTGVIVEFRGYLVEVGILENWSLR